MSAEPRPSFLADPPRRSSFASTSLWLALLGLAAAIVAWRVVVTQVPDLLALRGDDDAAAAALRWNDRHAPSLYARALQALRDGRHDDALPWLEAAVRSNPADGRSYALIAQIREVRGEFDAADAAMRAATAAAPRRTDVQEDAGVFWIRRGNVAQALQHFDVALARPGEARARLFPVLLDIADSAELRPAFAPLLARPLPWWPEFFAHAARQAAQTDTLRALHGMQSEGPNELTPEALRVYLQRLQRDGLWLESYITWLNSLGRGPLGSVGNLFNGSFELPLSNLGFDWLIDPLPQVQLAVASTYGATGGKALRVSFAGPRVRFRHLRQPLLLGPGPYMVQGRVRPDGLQAVHGLQWVVYCLDGEEPLGRSERFVGTDQWRRFSFNFTVPDNGCAVQMIRLELAGRVPLDFEAKGSVWFDDLSVEQRRID
jgi:tetratricopeptide (TPR) repeat protein